MAKSSQSLKAYISVLLLFCSSNVALASGCQEGQYLREGRCHPCPANTYMPESNHHRTSCFTCRDLSNNEDSHAAVLQPCTSHSPTMFGCQDGYYRNSKDLTSEENCLPCDTCPGQHVRRRCDVLHNTVCCPRPGMVVVKTDQGFRCSTDSATTNGNNGHQEL